MPKGKSLFETWSALPDRRSTHRANQDHLPFVLSVAGALAVAPFAVFRWKDGDLLLGAIDTAIVLGFVALGAFVYRTGKVRVANNSIVDYFRRWSAGHDLCSWATANSVDFSRIDGRVLYAQTTGSIGGSVAGGSRADSSARKFNGDVSGEHDCHHDRVDIGNRRALQGCLTKLVEAYEREPTPASLIIIDIDHFKMVNDAHGHATGDTILRRIAQIVDMRLRSTDGLYRIGGEEFVAVIDKQGLEVASQLAEEIRLLVEGHELSPGVSITVSLGVAELKSGESRHEWLHRADEALYEAKEAGRNAMRIAS